VLRISGAAPRLVAASTQQREQMAAVAARFSEEDLTRYLQLSLDLFRDLQYSLQPRFHLEIGLLRLVQAGRLMPIEEALARVSASAPPPATQRTAAPAIAPVPTRPAAPPRSGPSPFELDRAKKAAARPPEPQSSGANALAPAPEVPPPMAAGDPRQLLHSYLHEKGFQHLADAVENAAIAVKGAELAIVAAKSYALYFKDAAFEAAVREVFGRPLRLNISVGDTAPPPAIQLAPAAGEDQATTRALANSEVRRFQEVFGGEIRKVRNLKES